jgi:hypothetical protein
MPDDDNQPPWHGPNKGKARDDFSADKPRDEPKPPPPEQKPDAAKTDKPVLRHHPRSGAMYEDRSGKRVPPSRKHTPEQIEQWAVWKKREMAERHERMREEQRRQHEQEKRKALNRASAAPDDAPTLKTVTERHERQKQRLEDSIKDDQHKTADEIAKTRERGQILDTEYLAMIEREHRENEIGKIFDRHAGGGGDIDPGRGSSGRGGRGI